MDTKVCSIGTPNWDPLFCCFETLEHGMSQCFFFFFVRFLLQGFHHFGDDAEQIARRHCCCAVCFKTAQTR